MIRYLQKPFTALFCAAALLITMIAFAAPVNAANPKLGDVNFDDTVNVLDAIALYGHFSGTGTLSAAAVAAGDTNEDGVVNMLDAIALYNAVAGSGAAIPEYGNYFYNAEIDSRVTESAITLLLKEVRWANGNLVATCYIVNTFAAEVDGINIRRIRLYDEFGTVAADGNFADQNFTLEANSYMEHTFTFTGNAVGTVGTDLTYLNCQYEYTPGFEEQVAILVNIEREAAGLAPLIRDTEHQSLADTRAAEAVEYFSHTRPDGTKWYTVFDGSGINYSTIGENLASGHRTPAAVMEGWMNSDGHRANILNAKYTHIIIGFNSNRWVQLFYAL